MGAITHLLIHTAQHQRNRPVRAKGRAAEHWDVVATALKCRLNPAGYRERQMGQQLQTEITDVLYTDPDAGLARGDRVVKDGKTYVVVAALPPSVETHHGKWALQAYQPGTTS